MVTYWHRIGINGGGLCCSNRCQWSLKTGEEDLKFNILIKFPNNVWLNLLNYYVQLLQFNTTFLKIVIDGV